MLLWTRTLCRQVDTLKYKNIYYRFVTLSEQGICLRYGVSVVDVRRLNNFSGNAFRSKKVLTIPVQSGVPVSPQEQTPEVTLQRFKNATGESTVEAKYYLDGNDWDLEKALTAWKTDDNWSQNHGKKELDSFSKQIKIPGMVTPQAITIAPAVITPPTVPAQTFWKGGSSFKLGFRNNIFVKPARIIDPAEEESSTPLLMIDIYTNGSIK